MTRLIVDSARRVLITPYGDVPCALGRGGTIAAADKREGDGCTPLGEFLIRGALFRRKNCAPPPGLALPWRWIDRDDGWSDDPADPAYNRPVRHPHAFSAERLWRDDAAYDAILVLGCNDDPVQPGRGSAIFFHCKSRDATEGCITVHKSDLRMLADRIAAISSLLIVEGR